MSGSALGLPSEAAGCNTPPTWGSSLLDTEIERAPSMPPPFRLGPHMVTLQLHESCSAEWPCQTARRWLPPRPAAAPPDRNRRVVRALGASARIRASCG